MLLFKKDQSKITELTQEELEKMLETHDRIAHVVDKYKCWQVVYRAPTSAEYKRFRSMAVKEDQKAEATENLARVCVIYPSREEFNVLLAKYPSIAETSSDELTELSGYTADKTGK
jgi:hypothetical protein